MSHNQMKHDIKSAFKKMCDDLDHDRSVMISGSVSKITGMKIEAINLAVPVGTVCEIMLDDDRTIHAEVIGFSLRSTILMSFEYIDGIKQGNKVIPVNRDRKAYMSMGLLGRVIDARGLPMDGKGDIIANEHYPLVSKPINPLLRKKLSQPLDVGIRAINGLLTVGKGQRLGIFAGSGVGKSVLLGMMTRFTSADIVVVGLIGERGREVKEFIEDNLGSAGLAKSVVVAAPADTSPLTRANGAMLAATIAEFFRDKGFDVLLILDSLTRFAQAQREIGLSIGELPATKGYTPSVFAKISQLVERSGNGSHQQGSITAFYTVLVEGDDYYDPIGDHAKSVLDGHIVLSRELAEAGHYPAIDIEKSISRVMQAVAEQRHIDFSRKFKQLYGAYQRNRDLINVGMYQQGADKVVDEAIQFKDSIMRYLRQRLDESCTFNASVQQLSVLFQAVEKV